MRWETPDWLRSRFPAYLALVSSLGAHSLHDGLIRVFGFGSDAHTRDVLKWNRAAWRAAYAFEPDALIWAENVFGDQLGCTATGESLILRCESGSIERLQERRLDSVLLAERARLTSGRDRSLLERVRSSSLWPSTTEHVGFALPLAVGGRCEIENVEIVDGESHLLIVGEILARTRSSFDGTTIRRFEG